MGSEMCIRDRFVRLAIQPKQIKLASPLVGTRITTQGVDADGRPHDISGVGFGTQITASPAANVHIGADGTIRARRRGRAVLRAVKGDVSATVQVSANWPDLFEGEDAVLPPSGAPPRIVMDREEVASTTQSLTVQCSDLPSAAVLLLATSPNPLPAAPLGFDSFGLKVTPIVATGATATVQVAHTLGAGCPMFVRLYAFDQTLTTVIAASQTVVVTRGS